MRCMTTSAESFHRSTCQQLHTRSSIAFVGRYMSSRHAFSAVQGFPADTDVATPTNLST
jgi:hypothetical protein